MIASTPLEANKQGLKETRLRSAQEDVVISSVLALFLMNGEFDDDFKDGFT